MLRSISTSTINAYTLLIMAIGTITAAAATTAQSPAVVDVDGQPLGWGTGYYVLPAATDTAGGLTLVNRTRSCPLYMGQEPLSTVVSQGLPIKFSPVTTGENVVGEGRGVVVGFSVDRSICGGSNEWMIGEEDEESSRRLIVVGEEKDLFRIDSNGGLYSLGWCPSSCNKPYCGRPRCGSIGILVRDGKRLLALDGAAFPFRFRRAQRSRNRRLLVLDPCI